MRAMVEVFVEGWAPGYGSPFEMDDALGEDRHVDPAVEVAPGAWSPRPGVDDGTMLVAFVDGVRRVDARLTLEDAGGPVAGLCGTYAVGAVTWDRRVGRSEVREARIERVAVFGDGRTVPFPFVDPALRYRVESTPGRDPGELVARFHSLMRRAEAVLAERLAGEGVFVVADGPINELTATEKVGFVKSHRVPYLEGEAALLVGALRPGERTPLFLIGGGTPYPRYSWYLRLADVAGGHAWSGIARVEAATALGLDTVVRIADRTAALLPQVASSSHLDPRAPQNLVPIGALERALRRRLGDPGFVYRALRRAVAGGRS